MEKSIESIWKKGFLHSDALVAPKINDLYNQKSKHLTDKMVRMFKVNLIVIMVVAVAILVGSIFLGAIWGGLIVSLLLAGLVLFSKGQFAKMATIEVGSSSYEYLIAVKKWRINVIRLYTRIYRFLYPMLTLTFSLGFWFSDFGIKIIDMIIQDPDVAKFAGVPWTIIVPTLITAVLAGIFAGKLYQIDLNLVYGRVFKRLDEMTDDMEELRK